MNRHFFPATLAIVGVFATGTVFGGQTTTIIAAKPTHYFYTPAAYVNPPNHLVLSLHEISFGLPQNLQIQASLFDNIGRSEQQHWAKRGFVHKPKRCKKCRRK